MHVIEQFLWPQARLYTLHTAHINNPRLVHFFCAPVGRHVSRRVIAGFHTRAEVGRESKEGEKRGKRKGSAQQRDDYPFLFPFAGMPHTDDWLVKNCQERKGERIVSGGLVYITRIIEFRAVPPRRTPGVKPRRATRLKSRGRQRGTGRKRGLTGLRWDWVGEEEEKIIQPSEEAVN